jgi:hypothetical protein
MGDYTGEININDEDVVIYGNSATLDAMGKGRFFNGNGTNPYSMSLELHDLTLKNGNSNTDLGGGAIYLNTGSLKAYTTSFVSNNAQCTHGAPLCECYGGAIWITNAHLELHSTIFSQNTVSIRGIIHISSAVVARIYDSVFDSNSAEQGDDYYGGTAIYIVDSTLELQNTTFKNNENPTAGGAVFVNNDGAPNVTFIGCSFVGNSNTKGDNDVTREDASSNVTFACGAGMLGKSVTMKADELELTNPPDPSLHCTVDPAAKYYCKNGGTASAVCALTTGEGLPLPKCKQACLP